MVRRLHRKKADWSDDPMVDLKADVLRGLLDNRRWTPSQLAHACATSQQRISALLGPRAKGRCRRSLRQAVAEALEVSENLLSGEPVVPPFGPFVAEGFEYRYSRRTELAASRFLTLVATAVVRDLEKACGGRSTPSWPPPDVVITTAVNWIAELVLVKYWRQKLLVWNPEVESSRGFTEPATAALSGPPQIVTRVPTDEERKTLPPGVNLIAGLGSRPQPIDDPAHERAVLSLLVGVEHLLRPWFDGDAALNYRAIRDFAHLPGHPFAAVPEDIRAHESFGGAATDHPTADNSQAEAERMTQNRLNDAFG